MEMIPHAMQEYRRGARYLAVWLLLGLLLTSPGGDSVAAAAPRAAGQQPAGQPDLSVVAVGGPQVYLPFVASAPDPAGQQPAVQPDLSVVALGIQQVYLAWTVPATATGITEYRITRNGEPLITLDSGQLSYLDTEVNPSTDYVYVVEAVQGAGGGPARSKPIQIRTPAQPETPDTTSPSTPEITDAEAGDGRVVLAWDASTDDSDISGYIVQRDGRQLAIVNSGTQIYFDYDVQPQTTYQYTVEAVDVVGHHSQTSQPVSVTTGSFTSPAPALPGSPAVASSTSLVAAAIGGYTAQLRRYPYLTDVVGPYATINWATDRSGASGSVQWGRVGTEACTAQTTAATRTSISVNAVGEYQWKAQLTLTPGAEYCYRVFQGGTDLLGSDAAPHFFTQVPAGSSESFTFAVLGDWGSVDGSGANPDQANLMAQLAASGARFALSTGDNSYPSGSQTNYGDLVQTGSSISGVYGPQFWARVGASMPLFPALGNHGFSRTDTSHPHLLNWPQDRAVATSGGRYQKDTYCCLNGTTSGSYPSTWYAFDAGNARFYVLQAAWADTNLGTADAYNNDYSYQWTQASAQYQWLANDLATHPSGLKFAVVHYPPYSDNKTEKSDTYLQGAGSLEGLLAQNGVGIVFNGHAHFYERNRELQPQPPLLVSYVTGGGGALLEWMDLGCSGYDAYALGWSPTKNKGFACGTAQAPKSPGQVVHFLLVTVNGANVTVRGVNSLGATFDSQTYNFPNAVPTATPTPTATPGQPRRPRLL